MGRRSNGTNLKYRKRDAISRKVFLDVNQVTYPVLHYVHSPQIVLC